MFVCMRIPCMTYTMKYYGFLLSRLFKENFSINFTYSRLVRAKAATSSYSFTLPILPLAKSVARYIVA